MSGDEPTSDVEGRRAALRAMQQRKAADRDGSEPIGVMAHPEPAERRSEPTREDMSHDDTDPWKDFQRRGRADRVSDFDVPLRYQKPGWSYQWVTTSVFNQPETSTMRTMEYDGGWRAAKARDFQELVLSGTSPDASVDRDGQRLYVRPKRLTTEAQQEDMIAAGEQMRDRVTAAAAGNSAHRDYEALSGRVGVRSVPLGIEVSGMSGGGTGYRKAPG